MTSKSGQTVSDLLAAGVLQSVVQWIETDGDTRNAYARIQRRFPDAYPQSIQAVIKRGQQASDAGAFLNDPSGIGISVLPNIPVNPDRPAKYGQPRRRFQYRVTVSATGASGEDRYVTVFVQSGTMLSASDVRDKAETLAMQRWGQENAFGSDPIASASGVQKPTIVSVERTW